MDLNGKSILLTNYSIADFAGSEINCLSLACLFTQMGADVEVATLNYAYPIRAEFEKKQIKVKNVFFDMLEREHYDLIWAHHAVVLDYILLELEIGAERVVFSALSPFESFEAPPLYINDLSLCLANSRETAEQLLKEGVRDQLVYIFPNYVTESMYSCGPIEGSGSLRHIAVVSNHIPDEIHSAVKVIRDRGAEVEYFGSGNNMVLITEEILKRYDAVVTIGKTVQYCMALGIPVYCYDIHGGPGWICESVLTKAAVTNFSGRGFQKKNYNVIVEEIFGGYEAARKDANILREYIAHECILEKNVKDVLDAVEINKPVVLENIRKDCLVIKRWNRAMIQLYRYNLYREMKIVEINEEKTKSVSVIEKILTSAIKEIRDDYRKSFAVIEESIALENQKVLELEKKLTNEIATRNTLLQAKEAEIHALMERNDLKIQLQKAAHQEQIEWTQADFESRIKTLEGELTNCQSTIDKNNIELNQKEANTKYLMEVVELKDKQIGQIYCSRGWRCILLYRRIKNGVVRRLRKVLHLLRVAKKKQPVNPENKIMDTVNASKPLVTVAIPVYDRTDVLVESIESILHQTYSNIEIIAVCDGSPKETLDVVRAYEAAEKIRAFYFPDNSGNAVRGRNKAIREARGEYFAFQDSDDIAEPDRIEISVRYLEKYSADVVYGGWRALVDGSREIDIENGQEVFSPDCDYAMLKELCVPCQSTVMAKTEALRKVGGLKSQMRYREDHELWLRMAYYGYKFKSIDRILTNLRLHDGNLELTFKDGEEKWFDLMQKEHQIISPMKPKIAYLIPGCGTSGGIAVVCQHLNRLRDRGYDVLMISETEETEIKWFPNQKVEIVTMDKAPDNIDVLVATGWTTAHTALQIPAKRKYYFVQSDETRFNPVGSYSYEKALETYSMDYQFITEAKWIKNWLMEDFGKNAYYVPNGLDPELMYCTEKRDEIPNRKIRVLLEGPIDIPFKAMEDAFNAVNDLDCEVWCVSSAGTPKRGWHCDKFFSNVPMEQMKYIYSNCEILLKMSKVEGFFGPPMEMMACGGTCVVGKVTGYDEYIIDGYNALTVELGDVKAAHDAVKRLIHDHKLRNELARNGAKTAAEWRWDPSIDTLEKIFNS